MSEERKQLIDDLVKSEAWKIIRGEVIDPIYQNLIGRFRALTPANAADGPVIAAQANLLDKILDEIDTLRGKGE